MRCAKDDPYVFHYLLGGKPWKKDGELRRIYFDFFSLRGNEGWDGEAFPNGYLDVESGQWVTNCAGWSQLRYETFMTAAIKRRTIAPRLPLKHVYTTDGVAMAKGMLVMFVGGDAYNRPQWDVSKVVGRVLVASARVGAFDIKDPDKGRSRSYGNMEIKVREYADHGYPSCWIVRPLDSNAPLLISAKGGAFETQWSFLFVDPSVSLISIDGGSRFADLPDLPLPSINNLPDLVPS